MKTISSLTAVCAAAFVFAAGAQAQSASFSFAQPGTTGSTQSGSVNFTAPSVDESTVRKSVPTKLKSKAKKADKATEDVVERTKVHPDVAVKDTKPEEISLPGVMTIAGESTQAIDFTHTQTVNVNDTGSGTVVVSKDYSNHIQTPWINPVVKGTAEISLLPLDKNDNNVFISITAGVSSDVQIWVKDPLTHKVKGLILKPTSGISGQNIVLRDTGVSKGDAPKSDSYVAQEQHRMEIVALGNAPSGYSEIQPRLPAIIRNGLVITASRIYSSANTDIYVYDVANPGPSKALLTETEFDGPTVTAVSIFPKPLLNAKEHVKVIVEAKKGQ